MNDEVEAPGGESCEVGHVPLLAAQRESVALSHQTVLGELLVGQVEADRLCAGGGQHRHLLATPGGKTEHALAGDITEPVVRYRQLGREDDLPLTRPGLGDRV